MNLDQWIASTDALLELDAKGALVPHGIGGHASTLLQEAMALLTRSDPAVRERVTDEMVEAAAAVIWNDCFGRHGGVWSNPAPDSITGIQFRATARAALTAALRTSPPEPASGWPTHRHKKRGTEYVLIGFGKMQAENWVDLNNDSEHKVDMREVAIYRSVDDGSLWARPREDFEDGRFEALPTPPAKEPQ